MRLLRAGLPPAPWPPLFLSGVSFVVDIFFGGDWLFLYALRRAALMPGEDRLLLEEWLDRAGLRDLLPAEGGEGGPVPAQKKGGVQSQLTRVGGVLSQLTKRVGSCPSSQGKGGTVPAHKRRVLMFGKKKKKKM